MKSEFVIENVLPNFEDLSVDELDEIIALADKAKLEQVRRETLPKEIERLVNEYKRLGGDVSKLKI